MIRYVKCIKPLIGYFNKKRYTTKHKIYIFYSYYKNPDKNNLIGNIILDDGTKHYFDSYNKLRKYFIPVKLINYEY
jgi:hypothetical protein